MDSHSAFDAHKVISRVMYSDKDVEVEVGGTLDGGSVMRRYTVTHDDETGVLSTSAGREFNADQLGSLKQQLFRDRVLGELMFNPIDQRYELHLHAYVSGKHLWWPCPPAVRSFIFQRDMNLVVESILHADGEYLNAFRMHAHTAVFVHLESDSHEDFNEVMVFADVLGDKTTWALGASAISKRRLAFWDRCAAALYSWAVLEKDRANHACGVACDVSCSLDDRVME